MQNLRCLRILYCTISPEELESAFQRQSYPHILEVVMSADVYPMLQALRQIKKLTVNRFAFFELHHDWSSSSLTQSYQVHAAIIEYCHRLEFLAMDLLTQHQEYVHGIFSRDHIRGLSASF